MTFEQWRKYRKWRIGFAIMLTVVGGGGLVSHSGHHGAWGICASIGFEVTAALLLVDCGRRLVFPAMLGAYGAGQYASALPTGRQPDLFGSELMLIAASVVLLAVTLLWIAEWRKRGTSVLPDEDRG